MSSNCASAATPSWPTPMAMEPTTSRNSRPTRCPATRPASPVSDRRPGSTVAQRRFAATAPAFTQTPLAQDQHHDRHQRSPPDGSAPTYTTNITILTNYTTYQWYRDGKSLTGQTNVNLVFFGVERPDSGRYTLEAQLESTLQREPKGTRIDVLGVRPLREFPRPSGELVVWGREIGSTPPKLTTAVSPSPGASSTAMPSILMENFWDGEPTPSANSVPQ